MSEPCAYCTQKVFFAERQLKDGKTFHGSCLQKYLKEQKKPLVGFYPGDADRVVGSDFKHNQPQKSQN